MNENNDLFQMLSRWMIWILGFLFIFLWIGILFGPLFLPTIKTRLEKKYENFIYKDNLVKEEMFIYHIIIWSSFILGWTGTIGYLINTAP